MRSRRFSTPLNYRNLDDVPEFKGSNTTTEFLSKYIFDGLAKPARAGELGRPGRELKALRITLSEVAPRARAIRSALVVKHVVFAVPGSLDTPTGGYAYDRRIMAELRQLGWDVECLDIGEGFPSPDEATRSAARSLLLKVPDGQPIVMDGLALGVLPDVAAELASRHPLLGLVHHPLALEWGLSADRADALRRSEQAALAAVREVVVTSPATAKLVTADYGVPAERITVARPGNDPAPRSQGSRSEAPHLLSVGAVVPRKGFRRACCRTGDIGRTSVAADDRRRPHARSE